MPQTRTTPHPRVDVARELPWVTDRARMTARLHPRRARDLPADVNKMGGLIVWPVTEPWPRCNQHDSAYVPVLQLRSMDFPEMTFPVDSDLFQLLWCPFDHEECDDAPAPQVFWRRIDDIRETLGAIPEPSETEHDYVPLSCVLYPERVIEYPSAFDLSDEEIESLGKWQEDGSDLYQYELSTAPGTKLGGYVDWCQGPEWPVCQCGTIMEHLLTVDSCEFDGGSYDRWCPIEDRYIWNASFEARNVVQCPAGLMLGDMGAIYVFICRNCTPWRIASVFQCS